MGQNCYGTANISEHPKNAPVHRQRIINIKTNLTKAKEKIQQLQAKIQQYEQERVHQHEESQKCHDCIEKLEKQKQRLTTGLETQQEQIQKLSEALTHKHEGLQRPIDPLDMERGNVNPLSQSIQAIKMTNSQAFQPLTDMPQYVNPQLAQIPPYKFQGSSTGYNQALLNSRTYNIPNQHTPRLYNQSTLK